MFRDPKFLIFPGGESVEFRIFQKVPACKSKRKNKNDEKIYNVFCGMGIIFRWYLAGSGVGASGPDFFENYLFVGVCLGLKQLSQVLSPSICSKRLGFMFVCKASSIKSIPSLRANFAAETKSLSPDIRTI